MESNINDDCAPRNWLYVGFCITAIGFNLCLIAQLLTVGVAYFVDPIWWNVHVWRVCGSGAIVAGLGVDRALLPKDPIAHH
jgi:hypothetical protein